MNTQTVGTDVDDLRSQLHKCGSTQARYAQALSLLCEQAQARSGALFGMRGGALEPLTDLTGLAQDVVDFASGYLSAEIDHSAEATLTAADNLEDWGSGLSHGYVPLLLRTRDQEGELVVGLAVLDPGEGTFHPPRPAFIEALSDALLEGGELEPVRAA